MFFDKTKIKTFLINNVYSRTSRSDSYFEKLKFKLTRWLGTASLINLLTGATGKESSSSSVGRQPNISDIFQRLKFLNWKFLKIKFFFIIIFLANHIQAVFSKFPNRAFFGNRKQRRERYTPILGAIKSHKRRNRGHKNPLHVRKLTLNNNYECKFE